LEFHVPTQKRLLIVEDEALIALDIQRVVEDAFGQSATVVRDYAEAARVLDRLGEFGLAVVAPPRGSGDRPVAARLIDAGVAVVVCSAAMIDLTGTPLAGSPTVNKPFTDSELLAACHAALGGRC
jgi:CheY-like chemotaxis protein